MTESNLPFVKFCAGRVAQSPEDEEDYEYVQVRPYWDLTQTLPTYLGAIKLAFSKHDRFVMVEQDNIVPALSRKRMTEEVLAHPDEIIVAPYLLYAGFDTGQGETICVWIHRIIEDTPEGKKERWIRTGEPFADAFAFGCTYIPKRIWKEIESEIPPKHVWYGLDAWISSLTHKRGYKARVVWEAPVLHYHFLGMHKVTTLAPEQAKAIISKWRHNNPEGAEGEAKFWARSHS